MLMRMLCVPAVVVITVACAQSRETEDAAQAQQAPPAENTQAGAAACFVRGNAAGRASALDSAVASIGGQEVKLCYGRPKMNGRTIMGSLVPYGQPWRLGANEATTIHMPAAGSIAGVNVPAGSYSLYVVPSEGAWQVHVNRNAQRWGIPIDANVTAADVGAAEVAAEAVDAPVEALTARFEDATAQGATLVFEWERTRVRIPVTLAGS